MNLRTLLCNAATLCTIIAILLFIRTRILERDRMHTSIVKHAYEMGPLEPEEEEQPEYHFPDARSLVAVE